MPQKVCPNISDGLFLGFSAGIENCYFNLNRGGKWWYTACKFYMTLY